MLALLYKMSFLFVISCFIPETYAPPASFDEASCPTIDDFTQMPIKESDRCLVCGAPLNEEDVVIQYRGRRVPLTKEYQETFLISPDDYFYKLQPRGALFTEQDPPQASYMLVYISSVMILFIVSAAGSSALAMTRGYQAQRWFFIGLFIPFFAPLYLMMQKQLVQRAPFTRMPRTIPPHRCSHCRSSVHPLATCCVSCGTEREPDYESETERVRQTLQRLTKKKLL